jgi:hypothetical protein
MFFFFLIQHSALEEYQVASIKYQEARAENQEIRLKSAWLEILVLALFNVSPLLHSSFDIRH